MAHSHSFEVEKGRIFVSGLFWQPLGGMERTARKIEIGKIAAEQSFDLIVMCSTTVSQVGFAAALDGAQGGMFSSAEVVSLAVENEGLNRNMVCATKIPDGRWLYIAQRDGVILHDGDLIGTEIEVSDRMSADLADYEWQTIFAPSRWGIHDSIEREFVDFLPRNGTTIDYKQLSKLIRAQSTSFNLRKSWPLVFLILLVIGAMFGYAQWKRHKLALESELLAIQQEQARQSAMASIMQAPHPWKNIAPALKFAKACETALSKVQTLWPGNWTLIGTTCGGGALTIKWTKQEHGWVSHFEEIEPQAEIDESGSGATLRVPLIVNVGEDEKVPFEKTRLHAIRQASESLGYTIDVRQLAEAAKAIPVGQLVVRQAERPWRELAWTASGEYLSPFNALASLDGAGFRVETISMSFKDGILKWNMKGKQYVQP